MAFKKPEYCKDCSLYSSTIVPPTYVTNSKVLLVAQSPGKEEIKYGRVLVGPSGILMNKVLEEVGIDRNSISLTNSILCFESKHLTDMQKEQARVHCSKALGHTIRKIAPKFIISCGNYALKSILGKEKISEKRGKVFISKEYNLPVLVTLHPAAIVRECSKDYPNKPYANMTMRERDFLNDLRQAQEFIRRELWEEANGFWDTNSTKERITDGKKLVRDLDLSGYHLGTDKDIEKIRASKFMSVDIELDKGLEHDSELLSVSISIEPGSSAVWMYKDGIPKEIIEELASPKPKIVASRPFDENRLEKYGIKLGGVKHDVLTLSHIIDENYHRYDLETVAAMYADMHNIKSVADGKRECLGEAETETLVNYNGVDSDAALKAFIPLYRKLKSDDRLLNYYNHFIIPVQDMLASVAKNGCKIDLQILEENLSSATKTMDQMEQDMLSCVPATVLSKHVGKLKFTRDAFMRDILFSKSGLGLKANPAFVTKKQRLAQISEDHLKEFISVQFVEQYLRWAKLHKVVTGYLTSLASGALVYPDGKIYPSTTLNKTVTGRTVINDPPIQTYPQHGEFAGLIKECIVADDGWVLGARDLSQSELRIAGWLANDKNILKAVYDGVDLHTNTAAKILLGCSLDKVTKDDRRQAKPVNFGLIYGMAAETLVDYAKNNYGVAILPDEAYKIRLRYFSYPDGYYNLPTYYKAIEKEILETGCVDGVLGRKRRFPSCKGSPQTLGSITDKGIWGENLRQGINYKIQNFSTDLAILGLMLFVLMIKREGLHSVIKPMWFIHDSIIFQAREDYYTKASSMLKYAMEEASVIYIKKYFGVTVGYPIDTDSKVGYSWKELE